MIGIKSLLPTAVLAVLGLFYLAVPHNIHLSSGLAFGLEHSMHMVLGVVLLVAAGLVYWKMGKSK